MKHVVSLDISHNLVESLEYHMIKQFTSLINLFAHHCAIRYVSKGAFLFSSIRILHLSHNYITSLQSHWISGISTLVHLFLQNNQIEVVEMFVFKDATKLKSLHLENNQIIVSDIEPNQWLSNIRLDFISTDDHLFCCQFTWKKQCIPKEHLFKSCATLITKNRDAIIFGVVAFLVFMLNGCILLFDFIIVSGSGRQNRRQKLNTIVFKLSNILYGLYLTGISIISLFYGEKFGVYQELWKKHYLCWIFESIIYIHFMNIFMLNLNMCLMLMYSVFYIRAHSNKNLMNASMISSLLTSALTFTIRKVLLVYFAGYYGNTLCFSFLIASPDSFSKAVKAIESTYLAFYFLLLLLSIVGFISIVLLLQQRDKHFSNETNKVKTSRRSVQLLIVYFVLLLISKTPVLITQLLTLSNYFISPEVYIWLLITSISSWPIGHPTLLLIRKLKRHCR